MNTKTILNTILITLIIAVCSMQVVSAEKQTSMKQYSVTPIFDDFQNQNTKSYFNIELKENNIYDNSLLFEVENKTSNEVELEVKSLNAFTSPQGVIQYDTIESDTNYKLMDESKKFTNYSLEYQVINIPPKEVIVVEVPVKAEDITGTLIGGISFTMLEEGESTGDNSQFNIMNELKTIVAVVINTMDDANYEDITYDKPFINTMPSYYAIRLPIENVGNNLLEGITVSYTVSDSKGERLFNNSENNIITLTPKTKINYPITWEYPKIIKNEQYRLSLKITYPNGEVIDMDETVVLTGNETAYGISVETSVPTVEEQEDFLSVNTMTIIGIVLIGQFFILYFIIAKNKRKRNLEETNYNQ